mgnify:CR=1 FL=1
MNNILMSICLIMSIFSYKSANATLIESTFNWGGWNGAPLNYTGSFTAQDLDTDGLIEYGEFSFFEAGSYGDLTSTLSDTGDIIIDTNLWVANGSAWLNSGSLSNQIGYFSWNNTDYACTSLTGCQVGFTSFVVDGVERLYEVAGVESLDEVTNVPEPSILALLSTGIIGLIGLNRRNKV